MSKNQDAFATYAGLMAAIVFWGLSFVATKIALETIPAFTMVFARFVVGASFFGILMFKRGFPRFSARDRWKILLTALFEPCLYFVFETKGLQYTSAPKASLIIATIPLAVMALAALFLKERARIASIFGIFISLAGIWLLVTGDPEFSWDLRGALLGDLLVFGAVVSAALYIVCARSLGSTYSSWDITSMQTFYGALFFAPAFLWEYPDLQLATISGRSLAAFGYLTVFATIAAYLCYNHALTKIPASRAAVFINGIPVVTAIGAWFLLGETLNSTQGVGGVLVLAAVLVTSFPDLKAARAKAAATGGARN
jgi:drug/metabolite transporter (DMT)-like permease